MKVVWTADAVRDRNAIRTFIASDNPHAAVRVDQGIGEAAGRLADFPARGREGRVAGTRELLVLRNWRLIYEVESETVWILAVVHVARAWPPFEDLA